MELPFTTLLRKLFIQRDKKLVGILLGASILVSIVETISLSALMIFIGIVTNFDMVLKKSRHFGTVYKFLGCTKPADFIIIIGLFLLAFYVVRLIINAVHIYYMNKFAQNRQQIFAKRLFERYLCFNYKDFVMKNSSEISQVILAYSGNATQIISAMLVISAEMFTIMCIYALLFYVNWKMTLVLTLFLTTKVLFVARTFSKKIATAGQQSKKYALIASKAYTESFWNYKFLKMIANDKAVRERFNNATSGLARANTVNTVWQSLPRFVLETIGFCMLISAVLYVVFRYNTASTILPLITMYALAFYRFLPSVNKIVTGYNQIMFNNHALQPIYDFLQHDFESLGDAPIAFNKNVTFHDVSFSYTKKETILHKTNVTINKGDRVGFVGESGAGKSTIADVIMGLFKPQHGHIEIDGVRLTTQNIKAWRQKIGYIPQTIYLFDGTVAENVVCGRDFDKQKVIIALEKACIYNFLQTKDGIDTPVGEAGIQFSGGQKQRIAIARAVYDNPDILVLDEATSALDNETEAKIMDEIYNINKDKTLIIIAHRLTTIKRCDKIYRIEKGMVTNATDEHVGGKPRPPALEQM